MKGTVMTKVRLKLKRTRSGVCNDVSGGREKQKPARLKRMKQKI